MTAEQTFDALILDTTPFRDNDLVVKLLPPGEGPLSAMAYSARKSRNRFPSGVDRLTLAEVTLTSKPNRMPVLGSVVIKEVFWEVKEDLDKSCAATLLTEMIIKAHVEAGEAGRLFDFSLGMLRQLQTAPSSAACPAALYSTVTLLGMLSFLPRQLTCRLCEPDKVSDAYFASASGEVSCARHAIRRTGSVPLSRGQFQTLNGLLAVGVNVDDERIWAMEPAEALVLLEKLEPLLETTFGRIPRSLTFLKDVAKHSPIA